MRQSIASVPVLVLSLCAAARALELGGAEIAAAVVDVAPAAQVEPVKQPVFLFCPHKENMGAWSLYVLADKHDPSKLLALGLEELAGKNSKEHTYKGVLSAQKDPSTPRSELAHLDAGDFAHGKLTGKDLLSIKVDSTGDTYKLTFEARIGSNDHFLVGGAEGCRDVILKYSSVYKCWEIKALKLENSTGENAVGKFPLTLTGIVFNVGMTMVTRICAVDEFGAAIVLMDR